MTTDEGQLSVLLLKKYTDPQLKMTPAAIDLDLLERRGACIREISPSPLTSKASSVGSHYMTLYRAG